VPAVTYPTLTTEPPTAVNIAFQFGSFQANAIVRSGKLSMNRAIGARANQNVAGGHAGFSGGRRTPTLELTIEAPALVNTPFHTSAGIDPYLLFENATEVSANVTIGSVQYNKFSIIPGKVQMSAPVALAQDDGSVLYKLTCQCNPTSVNNNDDVTVRFN
jgi:hypothetical protein